MRDVEQLAELLILHHLQIVNCMFICVISLTSLSL